MANFFTTFSIDEKECKVFQLKRHKSELRVETCFSVLFPQDETKDQAEKNRVRGEAVKAAFKERKFRPGQSILLIPKHYVTVRHAFLPSVADDELKQMAQFEAEKHIHFNVERHVVSHHVMKKEGVSGSHVLISAVDSPVIDEPLDILSTAGIQPDSVSVSSVALYNFFRYFYPDLPSEATYTLIHIGLMTIDLVILHKGILVFTRSTSHGLSKLLSEWNQLPGRESQLSPDDVEGIDMVDAGNSFSHARSPGLDANPSPVYNPSAQETFENPGPELVVESREGASEEIKIFNQWKTKIIQAIRQTYDFARREFDCPTVEKIYVSGEGAQFQNITTYISKNLGIEVERMTAGEAVSGADQIPPSYLPSLGASLEFIYEKGVHVNLIPRRFLEKQKTRQRKQNFLSLGVMIIGVLILGILYYRSYSSRQERLTNWYRKEVNQLKPQVARLIDMQKKTRIISSYVKDKKNALAILDHISTYAYLPKQVSITEFRYRKGRSVEISGHARTIKDLNQFIDDLEKSDFFEKVDIKQRPWINLSYNRGKVLNYTLICSF